jgi:hypothetical protein
MIGLDAMLIEPLKQLAGLSFEQEQEGSFKQR